MANTGKRAKKTEGAPKAKVAKKSAAGFVRMKVNASPESTLGVHDGEKVVHLQVDADQCVEAPQACVRTLTEHLKATVVE